MKNNVKRQPYTIGVILCIAAFIVFGIVTYLQYNSIGLAAGEAAVGVLFGAYYFIIRKPSHKRYSGICKACFHSKQHNGK